MTDNKNNDRLRIGVIGTGPIGGIITAALSDIGAFVVACDIDQKKMEAIQQSGLVLENKIEKKVTIPEICYSIQGLAEHDLNLIIIAVKTSVLDIVLEQLKSLKRDKIYFLVAQNGIDNELKVAENFGKDKTLRMVVNFAGNMSDLNKVNVTFLNPPNYIAALTPHSEKIAQQIVDLFNTADLQTEITENILDYVWKKAILNASISAICAVTRKTMKEVMDFPLTSQMVEATINESIQIAKKENIDIDKTYTEAGMNYLRNAGHHKPSMLIDLENGLKTEIDYLNGKIADYGRKHNLPAPLNQAVTALVHIMEQSGEK